MRCYMRSAVVAVVLCHSVAGAAVDPHRSTATACADDAYWNDGACARFAAYGAKNYGTIRAICDQTHRQEPRHCKRTCGLCAVAVATAPPAACADDAAWRKSATGVSGCVEFAAYLAKKPDRREKYCVPGRSEHAHCPKTCGTCDIVPKSSKHPDVLATERHAARLDCSAMFEEASTTYRRDQATCYRALTDFLDDKHCYEYGKTHIVDACKARQECTCPKLYAPVLCSSNMRTYSNLCEANCDLAKGCTPTDVSKSPDVQALLKRNADLVSDLALAHRHISRLGAETNAHRREVVAERERSRILTEDNAKCTENVAQLGALVGARDAQIAAKDALLETTETAWGVLNASLTRNNQALRNEASTLRRDVAQCQTAADRTGATLNATRADLKVTRAAASELRSTVASLQTINHQLQTDVQRGIASLAHQNASHAHHSQSFETEKDMLSKLIADLRTDHAACTGAKATCTSTLAACESDKRVMQEESTKSENENGNLLARAHNESDACEARQVLNLAQITRLANAKDALAVARAELEGTVEAQSVQLRTSRTQIRGYQDSLAVLTNVSSGHADRATALAAQLQVAETARVTCEGERTNAQTQNIALSDTLVDVRRVAAESAKVAQAQGEELQAKLLAAHASMRAANASHARTRAQCASANASYVAQVGALDAEVKRLVRSLEGSDAALLQSQRNDTAARVIIADLRQQMAAKIAQHDSEASSCDANVRTLQDELGAEQKRVAQLQSLYVGATGKHQECKSAYELLDAEHATAKLNHEVRVGALQQSSHNCTQAKDSAEARITVLTAENEACDHRRAALVTAEEALLKKLQLEQQQLAASQQAAELYNASLKLLHATHAQAQASVTSLTNQLDAQTRAHSSDAEQYDRRVRALQDELAAEQSRVTQLQGSFVAATTSQNAAVVKALQKEGDACRALNSLYEQGKQQALVELDVCKTNITAVRGALDVNGDGTVGVVDTTSIFIAVNVPEGYGGVAVLQAYLDTLRPPPLQRAGAIYHRVQQGIMQAQLRTFASTLAPST